jgi:very-short-patch-repair endonuclease
MGISLLTRRDILDFLIASNTNFAGKLNELEFLGRIWDLETMMSWDSRYNSAYWDIWQHRINNNDWDDHYLLCTRLDLLKCDVETFIKFIENCLHPIAQPDMAQANELLTAFNDCLRHDGYLLKEIAQLSGKPVFKVMRINDGVHGTVKNLIFAANGPKPEIVLIDAVTNDIQIVENEQYCLIYDEPIAEHGLFWNDLVEWWCERRQLATLSRIDQERDLYLRLLSSLASPPEKLLFGMYFQQFRRSIGDNLPALIPQVYLHYDPKTISQLANGQRLVRQRMDFLLLFSNHDRVVLEVDGQQHYSARNMARPDLYASMVAEDRRLRLAGYEIYRFGGYELREEIGKKIVVDFLDALFQRHAVKNEKG